MLFSVLKNKLNKLAEKKSVTISNLYITCMLVLIALSFITIGISHGEAFRYLIWHGETYGIYPDLVESLIHARNGNPYDFSAIYPPFAYCLYSILNIFIPGSFTDNFDIASMSSVPNTLVVTTLFFMICICLIIFFIFYSLKQSMTQKVFFALCFLLSSPVVFMLERGNSIIVALIAIMLYILLYDSDNKIQREIALIALAAAICLKIYPVLFGILLLVEKRYRCALRCSIYTLILFFVPFLFMGGFGAIPKMIANILSVNSDALSGASIFGYGFKVNLTNTMGYLSYLLTNFTHSSWIKLGVYLLALLSLVSLPLIKGKWKKVAILGIIVIMIPDFSWIYNVIYMIVPLLLFLNENGAQQIKGWNMVYALLFVFCFAPLPYGDITNVENTYNNMNVGTLCCSISLVIMWCLLLIEGYFVKIKSRKE